MSDTPTSDPDEMSNDPRNEEVHGDEGMPAEFIDTPSNQPGDQSPPNPATVDDGDDDD